MLSIVTRRDFLIGAAVGFFVVPYAAKFVREQATKLRGATAGA